MTEHNGPFANVPDISWTGYRVMTCYCGMGLPLSADDRQMCGKCRRVYDAHGCLLGVAQ